MEFDFVTKFKKGVLNVLPHELSHCYDLLELDFGRGEKLGDKSQVGVKHTKLLQQARFIYFIKEKCRQQNPSSFYFWDSYLRIIIQKSIRESHNFLNDPIIKS